MIEEIIRKRIGFDGFLMSDDTNMQALSGNEGERAAACVAAGCDVALPCNGVLADKIEVAEAVGEVFARRPGAARAGNGVGPRRPDGLDFARSAGQARRPARAGLVIHNRLCAKLRTATIA